MHDQAMESEGWTEDSGSDSDTEPEGILPPALDGYEQVTSTCISIRLCNCKQQWQASYLSLTCNADVTTAPQLVQGPSHGVPLMAPLDLVGPSQTSLKPLSYHWLTASQCLIASSLGWPHLLMQGSCLSVCHYV